MNGRKRDKVPFDLRTAAARLPVGDSEEIRQSDASEYKRGLKKRRDVCAREGEKKAKKKETREESRFRLAPAACGMPKQSRHGITLALWTPLLNCPAVSAVCTRFVLALAAGREMRGLTTVQYALLRVGYGVTMSRRLKRACRCVYYQADDGHAAFAVPSGTQW